MCQNVILCIGIIKKKEKPNRRKKKFGDKDESQNKFLEK